MSVKAAMLVNQNASLLVENQRLRAALKLYGRHAWECKAHPQWKEPKAPCSCGLSAALEGGL